MALMNAYKPTSYAPTNVTNGTSGATTPESSRNAEMQIPQSGSTDNPYAEAVTHTLNWMQYQQPPTPVTPPTTLPGMTPGTLPVTQNQPGIEPPVGEQPPVIPPTTQPPGTPGPTPDPTIPGIQPPTADPTKWWKDKAAEYAKIPGFEFLNSNPDIWAAYAAEMQTGPGFSKGPTFEEWAARNWEAIAAKWKMSPQNQQNFGYFVRQKAYQTGATRLQNELAAKNPNVNKPGGGGTMWITPQLVEKYENWIRGNPKGAHFTFWEWAGSVNKGINPWTGAPLTPGSTPGPGPGPTDPTLEHPVTRGPRGTQPPPGGPTGPVPEIGTGSMEDLIRSLRGQGTAGREAALRQFRHEAGLSGLNDMGAYNPALADLINKSIMDENSAIYEIINAKDEGERNRALEKYIAELQSKTGLGVAQIGANATLGAAGMASGASRYDADVRKLLGLAGLDVDRENNWWNNQLGYQDLLLRYLQLIGNVSPDPVLGGNPVPGGDVVVH